MSRSEIDYAEADRLAAKAVSSLKELDTLSLGILNEFDKDTLKVCLAYLALRTEQQTGRKE